MLSILRSPPPLWLRLTNTPLYQATRSALHITTAHGHGCGVVVAPGVAITASHVVDGTPMRVRSATGEVHTPAPATRGHVCDIAFFEVPSHWPHATLADGNPPTRTKLLMAAFTKDGSLTVDWARTTLTDSSEWDFKPSLSQLTQSDGLMFSGHMVEAGHSGSGLFHPDGRLAGMVCAKLENGIFRAKDTESRWLPLIHACMMVPVVQIHAEQQLL